MSRLDVVVRRRRRVLVGVKLLSMQIYGPEPMAYYYFLFLTEVNLLLLL